VAPLVDSPEHNAHATGYHSTARDAGPRGSPLPRVLLRLHPPRTVGDLRPRLQPAPPTGVRPRSKPAVPGLERDPVTHGSPGSRESSSDEYPSGAPINYRRVRAPACTGAARRSARTCTASTRAPPRAPSSITLELPTGRPPSAACRAGASATGRSC